MTDGNDGTNDIATMDDIVRWNDEAVMNWLANDHETAECLFSHAVTLLHRLCHRLVQDHPQQQQYHQPRKQRISTAENAYHQQAFSCFITKANVAMPNLLSADDSSIGRPYQKAFLLVAMIQGLKNCDQKHMIHLIVAVVFYNTGLFYHLGGTPRRCQLAMMRGGDDPLFRGQMVRRCYRQANVVLGRFMETTRQGRLWTIQAAIWHNIADSVLIDAVTTTTTTTFTTSCGASKKAAAVAVASHYDREVVWVNMTQLEAVVGWVEDAEDRAFFRHVITLVSQAQLRQAQSMVG
jgi:hypothetical protein